MPILIHEFMDVLERLAPTALAEEWDNVGLMAGERDQSADAILLALNLTDAVLDEAVSHACGLILTHHPAIFPSINSVSDETETGRLISRANREGIAVAAAHTNLDSAPGGLADILGELMGLSSIEPIEGADSGLSKLAVFVPAGDLERVRAALFAAGAGNIGDYRHCSYFAPGTGTFEPMEGANPAVGQVGKDEQVGELRLETVFPTIRTEEIISALTAAHSYEEPAYDIYALSNKRSDAGHGRVGELSLETRLDEFSGRLAELFGLRNMRYSGVSDRPVRRVALVPGSGADYIAAAARVADVLVTGDIKYHHLIQAQELGLSLVDLAHDVSEQTALINWAPRLQKELEPWGSKVVLSDAATGYWQEALAKKKTIVPDEEEKSMYHLHVDGGSRGNPGPAGIGAVLAGPDGETVDVLADYIGEATNNIAEYQAMISGLELALDRGITKLAIFSDSELIIRQLEGAYRVKNEGLRPYYQQAKALLARLDEYRLNSIPRAANAHADELVNQALDEAGH